MRSRRAKVVKSAAEPVVPGKTLPEAPAAPEDEGLVPAVLTYKAVSIGYMPAKGQSGLPASLEASVPVEYRYWEVADVAKAREVRDALVEKGLFTADSLLDVDGKPQRILKRVFLAEVEKASGEVKYESRLPAAQYAALSLRYTAEAVTVFEEGQAPAVEELAKDKRAWVAAWKDEATAVEALHTAKVKSVFKVRTRPGLVFGSSVELDAGRAVVEPLTVEPVLKQHQVRLLKAAKAKEPAEERYVLGIVLQPEVKDYQGDIYSAEEIRKTAHRFMEKYRQLGLQHQEIVGGVGTGKLVLLETWISPTDFTLGKEKVLKGTWLMAVRVVDNEIWKSVKDGSYTGFSIAGDAIRTAEKQPAAA